MSEQHPWRPSRRRLTDTLLAAIAPVAACSLALGGLTTWVGTGAAGSPPRISVGNGRVFLPFGDSRSTAAFFEISNGGDAEDRLVAVTSSAVAGEITLSRHSTTDGGAAYRADVDSAAVPAHGDLSMSAHGLDVTLRAKEGWQAGSLVRFTLHFRYSGEVNTIAVVIRPSERG